jgi:Na+/proline symporter
MQPTPGTYVTLAIFSLTLAATFAAALIARRHSSARDSNELTSRTLNKWTLGLSTGATANSGFVVTAAVGLGYVYGLQWVMLPLSWLLGDLIFWKWFPSRINKYGHQTSARTLPEILTNDLPKTSALRPFIGITAAALIIVCLTGYAAAQWLAGQKFLSGAFGLSGNSSLYAFSLTIVAYSTIGGFRGSIYTDVLQAIIRIIGTIVALAVVTWVAMENPAAFSSNIAAAGPDFLTLLPGGTLLSTMAFVGGFAAAAVGFGLGQPQVVTRYLAGSNPAETQSAIWIYNGFVQFTWIAMTLFGTLLRGVMPQVSDPEAGLSEFFMKNVHPLLAGIIIADVFATIAATANALLVSMAQAVAFDILSFTRSSVLKRIPLYRVTLLMGAITLIASITIEGSVMSLVVASVSMLGAGLAPAVMIKVMGWRHTPLSLLVAMLCGLASALAWRYSGLGAHFNESGVGLAIGLLANALVSNDRPLLIGKKSVDNA